VLRELNQFGQKTEPSFKFHTRAHHAHDDDVGGMVRSL
jgi:hypothetical protein